MQAALPASVDTVQVKKETDAACMNLIRLQAQLCIDMHLRRQQHRLQIWPLPAPKPLEMPCMIYASCAHAYNNILCMHALAPQALAEFAELGGPNLGGDTDWDEDEEDDPSNKDGLAWADTYVEPPEAPCLKCVHVCVSVWHGSFACCFNSLG